MFSPEDFDIEPLLGDMQGCTATSCQRNHSCRLSSQQLPARFMLLKRDKVSACEHRPRFPEPLHIDGPLGTLTAWWLGDASFLQARRAGLISMDGNRSSVIPPSGSNAICCASDPWFGFRTGPNSSHGDQGCSHCHQVGNIDRLCGVRLWPARRRSGWACARRDRPEPPQCQGGQVPDDTADAGLPITRKPAASP